MALFSKKTPPPEPPVEVIDIRALTGTAGLPTFELNGDTYDVTSSDDGLRRTPLSTLVASAVRRTIKKEAGRRASVTNKSKLSGWQAEAWELADELGEVSAPASQFANAASRAKFYVGRRPIDAIESPEQLMSDDPSLSEDDRKILEVWRAFGGMQSGRSQIIRRMAEQLWIIGESWLVGLVPEDLKDQDEVPLGALGWEVVSPEELTRLEDTASRSGRENVVLVDKEGEVLDTPHLAIRVWRSHPRYWWEANGPIRAARPVLRELVALGKYVSAQVDSRLAGAGLLAMTKGATVVTGSEEEEEAFVETFMEMMLEPIANRESASSLVPNIVEVSGQDASKAFHHLTFWSELDSEVRNLRNEAIRRWAISADLPAEQLLGEASESHWAAWLRMEETVRVHIEPMLILIADAITSQYLHPVAEQAGVENPEDYVVWFDSGPLTERPHRTDVALELYDRGEMSGVALRREARYSDDDAPQSTPREDAVSRALSLVSQAPSLLSQIGLPALVREIEAVLSDDLSASAREQDDRPAPEREISVDDSRDVDIPDQPGSERPSADGPGTTAPSSPSSNGTPEPVGS